MRLSPDQLVNQTLEREGTGNLALQRSAAVFGTAHNNNNATVDDQRDSFSTQSTPLVNQHRDRVG